MKQSVGGPWSVGTMRGMVLRYRGCETRTRKGGENGGLSLEPDLGGALSFENHSHDPPSLLGLGRRARWPRNQSLRVSRCLNVKLMPSFGHGKKGVRTGKNQHE